MLNLVLFFFLLCSCQNNLKSNPTTEFSDTKMTMAYHIIIGSSVTDSQKKQIQEIVDATFNEINATYNKWNPNSELSKLNDLKANEKVPISKELTNFLKATDQIVTLSKGKFDPTIEPLQALWKKYLKEGKEPSNSDIDAIVPAIGWHHIHFSNDLFYKDHDLTALDLGGIAKGYCVDLLTEHLNHAGFPHLYVEWGGEIRTTGKHPDNRPWRIFISNLGDNNPSTAIAHLDLVDSAVATSGDYMQNWTVGPSTTYSHIIDPHQYRPLRVTNQSIASATVTAPTCMLADALATVAMMFDAVEEAEQWLTSVKQRYYPDIAFWVVTRDQEKFLPQR